MEFLHNREGWSIRGLARYFTISRNTVRQILRKHEARRDQGYDPVVAAKRVARGSKLDPHQELIESLLEKYPKLSGQRFHEELQAAGYTGGISILRDHLRRCRNHP